MTKSKYPFVDKTQRNKDIIELRNKGTRYKAIAREVGCTTGVVTAVLKKLSHDLQLVKGGIRPYNYVIAQSSIDGLRGGKMSELCDALGLSGVKWVWKNKPNGMTFAEYTGVLLRDVYLDAVEEEENK
jgi:hypothetical protein